MVRMESNIEVDIKNEVIHNKSINICDFYVVMTKKYVVYSGRTTAHIVIIKRNRRRK